MRFSFGVSWPESAFESEAEGDRQLSCSEQRLLDGIKYTKDGHHTVLISYDINNQSHSIIQHVEMGFTIKYLKKTRMTT